MICSFCRKPATELATHSLCGCCSVHLKCYEAAAVENQSPIETRDKVTNRRADCEFCRKKYPRNKLDEHRKLCMALQAFRCTVCDDVFVNKAGLWNHLDLHKVATESKESYYRETRVTSNLRTCGLCKDQRGYQETLYWRHIHEDHDGFFLQCSGCGNNFRSHKSRNDHMLSCCEDSVERILPTVNQKANMTALPVKPKVPPLVTSTGGKPCENAVLLNRSVTEEISSSGSSNTKCCYCSKVFLEETLLVGHMENCHLPNVCNICGETILGKIRYRYHKLKIHTESAHKCQYCAMVFHRYIDFRRHMSKHVGEGKFRSKLCGAKFKSLKLVAVHTKQNHRVRKRQSKPPKSNENKTADQSSLRIADKVEISNSYRCLVCDVRFDDEEAFSQHFSDVHQQFVCTLCGSTFANVAQLNEHKETYHPTVKYKCNHCKHSFRTEACFQEHLAEHEKKETFLCELCDQRFEDQNLLTSHMASDHNAVMNPDGSQYTCPICGETIPSIRMLRHHKLKFHTEPKYRCSFCPRKFFTKGNYLSHTMAHKRKRRFSCQFCRFPYKSLTMLQAHIERQHGSEVQKEEQPGHDFNVIRPEDENLEISTNACHKGIKEEIIIEETSIAHEDMNPVAHSECNQLFNDANVLQDHLNHSHQTWKCEVCEMPFDDQLVLMHHKLISHTEPRHKCSRCEKRYHARKALVRHEWMHGEVEKFDTPRSESPEADQLATFECSLCSRTFIDQKRLMRHMDNMHINTGIQCTICNLTFPSRYKMHYHRRIAHTAPEHQCSMCEKKFHVKYRLKDHLAVHFNEAI